MKKIQGKCEFVEGDERCPKKATTLAASSSSGNVGCFCDEHADVIEVANAPEYVDTCPNCGCRFGIG